MVSSRTLCHACTIQQHLGALTTDVLRHEVGWIGGRTDLDDLDDSPINLVLHSQSLRFDMLDLSDPPAHGQVCETPDILRHSEVTKETLQSEQVTYTSNDCVEFSLTRPQTNNSLCTGPRTEGVCATHRAWSESEFLSTKLASS